MELAIQPKTELYIAGEKISAGLVAFEERKAKLTALKDEAAGLTINGVADKGGLLIVSSLRKRIKVARVETEKEAFTMRSHLTKISKDISLKEDELIAIIQPSEKALQAEEDKIADEKETIRLGAEKAEQERIQKRIDQLAAYGFAIGLIFIQSIDDATFEKVLSNAKAEHEKELVLKAEEKRLADIDAQKLIDERKELEELRKNQVAAQKIIDDQNEKIIAAQKKIDAEKLVIEQQKQKIIDDKKRADELEWEKAQAIEKARLEDIASKERGRIAEEEKLSLASDKVKFKTVIEQLGNVQVPAMKSAKSKKLATEVLEFIGKINDHILSGIK